MRNMDLKNAAPRDPGLEKIYRHAREMWMKGSVERNRRGGLISIFVSVKSLWYIFIATSQFGTCNISKSFYENNNEN